MKDTKEWTPPYYGVTHFQKDKIQYTLNCYQNFITGFIFNWNTHKYLAQDLFFTFENNKYNLEKAKQFMEKIMKLNDKTFILEELN